MTDKEIIKGLECCYQALCCEECPYNSKNNTHSCFEYEICNNVLMNDIIGLISRQEAEIEELKEALHECHKHDILDCTK